MKLRLGLIGLSTDWTTRHLPALRMLAERFEVSGVYNSVASLASKAANEFDARPFDGFREMVAHDSVDAVLFLESGWYGTSPINAACDFGKAIYCGSEVAIEPDRATSLKSVVEQSGVAFMAEFPRRLAPATLRLKELIATKLGRPKILFCHKRLVGERRAGAKSKCEPDLNRELVELMDWCAFVAGRPIRRIQGTSHFGEDNPQPDYVGLSLELGAKRGLFGESNEPASGDSQQSERVIAQISCGSYIPPQWQEAINFRPPAAMQVCCENGVAFLDLPNSLIWFDDAGRHQESLDAELAVGQQLLTQFHRAVTSLVRKMADLEDVCQGLQALQIAEESVEKGCGLDMPC